MGSNSKYIKFADPEVARICIANFSSNGKGVTYEDAAAVRSLGNVFAENSEIVTFDELQYFTGLRVLSGLYGCSRLTSITIPSGIPSTEYGWIRNSPSLREISFIGDPPTKPGYTFEGMPLMTRINVDSESAWLRLQADMFYYVSYPFNSISNGLNGEIYVNGVKKNDFIVPNGTTRVPAGSFYRCNFNELRFPASVSSIGTYVAAYCHINRLVIMSLVPPDLEGEFWFAYADMIYVPYSSDHSIIEAYKTDSKWGHYQTKIFELNPDGTIPNN